MNRTEATPSASKLIAVDLDGTLIAADNSISDENVAAIRRAVDRGAAVVLATGRAYVSADDVACRIGLPPVPVMAFNGAVIRWSGRGGILSRCCLPADAAREVVQYCREHQLHLHYYLDDAMYVTGDNHWSRSYCERAGMDFTVVPDMREFAGKEPIKLLVIDEPEKIKQLVPECQDRWRNRLYITRSMAEYLEFLSPQVSKGRALDWLIDFFGVARQNTLAIGDSMNDLPLLDRAGYAAAMPHSDADVKASAQFVPSDPTAAVAAAINWFFERC